MLVGPFMLVSQSVSQFMLVSQSILTDCSLEINSLKQPIQLFIMWKTIILVKLTELWFRCKNDWFRRTNESIGSTMKLVENIILFVDLTNIMVVHIINNETGCFNQFALWEFFFTRVLYCPKPLTRMWLCLFLGVRDYGLAFFFQKNRSIQYIWRRSTYDMCYTTEHVVLLIFSLWHLLI